MKLIKEIIPSFSYFKRVDWKDEIPGAVVGAILAIPQGITFAFLAGVPAQIGVYCAIYVTFLVAFFGNSIMMSGPNTATSILMGLLVVPEVQAGLGSATDCILALSFLAGAVQLLIWLFRGAFIFNYLQSAAIAGVTMGVGCLIMKSSVKELIGAEAWPLAVLTILSGFIFLRFIRKHYLFLMIIFGTVSGFLLTHFFQMQVEYLGDLSLQVFHWETPVLLKGDFALLVKMLPAAIAVAFVSLLHSLVIAKDLKNRRDRNINLNKEVFAIGLANMLSPFMMSFAGAGSFNRTQANEEMKVSTPMGAILTALFILLLFLTAGQVFDYLPVVVVTGVLFVVGYKMIHFSKIVDFARSPAERLVFFPVFLAMVLWGIVPAVVLAVCLSMIPLMKKKVRV